MGKVVQTGKGTAYENDQLIEIEKLRRKREILQRREEKYFSELEQLISNFLKKIFMVKKQSHE